GEVINEADVQTWYNGLNAPETYPWPSLPARFLPAC
ncbi:MAG TPA: RNA pseudouridine synthase, partial [Alteromonas macleodii]|nr:RNA pseudouridine synthase [Alteromonas macleodii]